MDPRALAIPTYVQMLKGLSAQLTKGEAFAAEGVMAPEDLIGARLAPDMFRCRPRCGSSALRPAIFYAI